MHTEDSPIRTPDTLTGDDVAAMFKNRGKCFKGPEKDPVTLMYELNDNDVSKRLIQVLRGDAEPTMPPSRQVRRARERREKKKLKAVK